MFVDARRLEDGSTIQGDVCVIGAGAAGITLARELAGGPLDVVVLESGGLESDPATQALYEGEMTAGRFVDALNPAREIPLHDVRLRYFGGTTNHWAGTCRPLEPIDFETREYLDVSGWPIDRAALDPFYARAQDVIGLGPYQYDWEWWEREHALGAPLVETPAVSTTTLQINFPMSFGSAYRDELDRADNVSVYLWANAVDLVLTDDGSQLDRVAVATLEGREHTVRAQVYVLATGGLEVPRLLLASNGVRTSGVGNEHDLVGRYFTEHLLIPAAVASLARSPEELVHYRGVPYDVAGSPGPDRTIEVQAAMILTESALRAGKLLGLELQMVPGAVGGGPAQTSGVTSGDLASLVEAVAGTPAGTAAYLQAVSEQQLDPENRVSLSRGNVDALGLPEVSLTWRPRPGDVESVTTGLQVLARELGRLGIGRVQLGVGDFTYNDETPPGGGPATFYKINPDSTVVPDLSAGSGVGFHHMCTTRMAASPREGVVDANCRIHSVPNLYVGGSAAFGTGGASNPTLTIVALALRLADHLRDSVL